MDITIIPPGSIVVGVDGSQTGQRALDWAAEEAALEGRLLVILHAVGTLGTPGTVWLTDMDPAVQKMRQTAEDIVTTAARRSVGRHRSLETSTEVITDEAPGAILAASERAHMVVVGSRGRGPVRSRLLGSVSSTVARHARCPAVVVRPHHPGTVRRGVLVGADGTSSSRPTLDFAYHEASVRRLPLTVMHCVWDAFATATNPPAVPASVRSLEEAQLLLAESVAGMSEKYPDVHVTVEVGRGLPEQCLASAAERMDLLVVGSRCPGALSRLVSGDVASHLVEHAHTVVALVPHQQDQRTPAGRTSAPNATPAHRQG